MNWPNSLKPFCQRQLGDKLQVLALADPRALAFLEGVVDRLLREMDGPCDECGQCEIRHG